MNARIRKEARTLLPAMVVTLLSVAVPLIISGHKAARFGCFPLVFGFVTIGAISFGNEFQHRTIQMLLTQPIARTTVWLEKLMVLGTGIGIGLLIYLIGLLIFDADILYEADAPAAAVFIILSSLCAFCSTPYWTLIARNSLAGVVFSLVVPIFVLVGYELLDEHFAFGPRAELILTVAIGAAYSLFFHRLGYS
jgi:ABC-type transport system involved in multi-copper enzyme maturation permease subunit